MHVRRSYLVTLLNLLLVPLICPACQLRPEEQPVVAVKTRSDPAETVTFSSSATPAFTQPASLTDTAVISPMPVPTATRRPTLTPQSTPTPTTPPLPTPTIVPVDRTCPDTPPKPDYWHYYLSGRPWPTPDPTAETHFWLSSPVSGTKRLEITDWFPYGYDVGGRYLLHNGVDVAEPLGTPLLAAATGTVVVAGDDTNALYGWRCNWYGRLVVIELDDRWQGQSVYLLYGHVLNISVAVGQRVTRGQPVAEIGLGGAAALPHLHFEVRVGTNTFEATRNPLLWLAPNPRRGVIAGRLVDPEGRPWQGVVIKAAGQSEGTADQATWTYLGDPQPLVNPDEGLAENFVIGDLPPGRYELTVTLQGVTYTAGVAVAAGRLSTVEIVTEPFKTPTPGPTESAGPLPTPLPTSTPSG